MIKMVVFDMAGTTVNETNIVYKTLLKTINDSGYNFSLEEVLATGAGKEKLTAIKDIIALSGAIPLEQLTNKIYTAFTAQLASAYNEFKLLPQPGAEELFIALKKKNIL